MQNNQLTKQQLVNLVVYLQKELNNELNNIISVLQSKAKLVEFSIKKEPWVTQRILFHGKLNKTAKDQINKTIHNFIEGNSDSVYVQIDWSVAPTVPPKGYTYICDVNFSAIKAYIETPQ